MTPHAFVRFLDACNTLGHWRRVLDREGLSLRYSDANGALCCPLTGAAWNLPRASAWSLRGRPLSISYWMRAGELLGLSADFSTEIARAADGLYSNPFLVDYLYRTLG